MEKIREEDGEQDGESEPKSYRYASINGDGLMLEPQSQNLRSSSFALKTLRLLAPYCN